MILFFSNKSKIKGGQSKICPETRSDIEREIKSATDRGG